MPPEKIHVVQPGFNPEQFGPVQPVPPPDGEPYLLYIGNVMPHKTLVRLVEAFAVTRRLPARLVLRGWGRDRQVKLLGERIRALGLERQIDWQPYAPDDELLTLYRGAQALVDPSLHEGFGLTALEAMACGTPVVASGVSSKSRSRAGSAGFSPMTGSAKTCASAGSSARGIFPGRRRRAAFSMWRHEPLPPNDTTRAA